MPTPSSLSSGVFAMRRTVLVTDLVSCLADAMTYGDNVVANEVSAILDGIFIMGDK